MVAAYIKSLKLETKKILSITPLKALCVYFKVTCFFLQPKRSRLSLSLLANCIVMFLTKESFWRRIPGAIRYPWHIKKLAVSDEKYKISKNKEIIIAEGKETWIY